MNKYSLQKLTGKYEWKYEGKKFYDYSNCLNQEIAQCLADNKGKAIEILQNNCPVKLDKSGYAKDGLISYCVAEYLL